MNDVEAAWDPCQVISWRVVSGGNFPAARTQVVQAMAELTDLTGLRFEETTSEYQAIAVEWIDQNESGWAGRNGRAFSYVDPASGYRTGGHIQIKLYSDGAGQLPTVRHELTHVLGLGHAHGFGQLMSEGGDKESTWMQGDLAGLAKLYPSKGCAK